MRARYTLVAFGLILAAAGVGEAQEPGVVAPVGSPAAPASEASKKIVSSLRRLIGNFKAEGITRENAAASDVARRFSSSTMKVDAAGRVQVYVSVADADAATLDRLRQHGLDIELVNADLRLVQGWIPVLSLEALATEPSVVKIRPPAYGRTRVGTVTTQGDAIHRCDQARAAGITGAGVKVGVVSNGVSGLAASQASGNLDAVQVLSPGTGNEGTAMLEIVHDCAPGAALAFSSGFPTSLAFIGSVNSLRNAGARVIVDDIGFFGEPFFEDGPVALNDRAVGQDVLRVSAAGNDALGHYQAMFTPGIPDPNLPSSIRHEFGGGDTLMRLRIPGFSSGLVILQWANRFGAAGDDYDLCVRRNGVLFACSGDPQDGNDDPIEAVNLDCSSPSACFFDVQVTLFSGVARQLKLFCLGCDFTEFNVPSGSIIGHPAVPEVLAVAAAPASSPTTNEPFSSEGPVVVFFPALEVRNKPDITGIDGVATSRPGFNPFFGTSAAAPHVAGVAALAIEANSAYQLPLFTAFLRQALRDAAADLGAVGLDNIFGAGRADAFTSLLNEANKARCDVRSSAPTVSVGQSFTLTVETFPGTGDPWDIYVLAVLVGTTPFRLLTLDFATGTFGPLDVIRAARPTAPITASSQVFGFVAPVPAEVALMCFLVDPGFTRVGRPSFARLSLVP